MAGRIFWVGLAGAALFTGMMVQDGDQMFGWGHDDAVSSRIDRRIDRSVDRAVDRGVHRLRVVDSEGRAIDASPESKRALAEAVGQLVEAEADYAVLRIRDADRQELAAARTRRDHARDQVDTLKEAIKRHEQAAGRDANQSRDRIRDDIRETVREAVRS